ncbi:hypothetical protein [Rhizobium leguminosarum]|uniref:Uncharacterized protein n=1 Tax=Rhizobium leguminosarum TaxID=384 RepID=A0A7W9ZZ03_RHILE|nr:hypothetical protein [Rhizobium leguminosarum]MBB6225015.1 hypothetical protein [Rhizobium leguminosarum]
MPSTNGTKQCRHLGQTDLMREQAGRLYATYPPNEKPSPAHIFSSLWRTTIATSLPPPGFPLFPATQNLFLELRMVLALQFALYSNEQKRGARTFGI